MRVGLCMYHINPHHGARDSPPPNHSIVPLSLSFEGIRFQFHSFFLLHLLAVVYATILQFHGLVYAPPFQFPFPFPFKSNPSADDVQKSFSAV